MLKKLMLISVLPVVFAVHGLQQELVTLKNRLVSLERALGTLPSGPIIDQPVVVASSSDQKPTFYANYRYILSDSQGVLFKANNSQILYEVGLVDSGYIKVENNTTKLKRVTKKETKQQDEKEVGGAIYNLVAYGPELKPEVLETDFKVIILKENKPVDMRGIKGTVMIDTYHIQYPTDLLVNMQNHIINPLVKKVYVLQANDLSETISQLLENGSERIVNKTMPEIDKNFPNATNLLPTYDAAQSFLEKEKKYLDERFFKRYMQGGTYDPADCVRLYDILPKMKRLAKQVSQMVDTLKKRNSLYGYLWQNVKNSSQSRSVVEEIKYFVNYLEPKLKQLDEHLDNQKQLITAEFQGKLVLFKDQLMKAKQENTLSLEPILFPKENNDVSTTIEVDTEKVDELVDLGNQLKKAYQKYKQKDEQQRREYLQSGKKEDLETYQQLAEEIYTNKIERDKQLGQSGMELLTWLARWNANNPAID